MNQFVTFFVVPQSPFCKVNGSAVLLVVMKHVFFVSEKLLTFAGCFCIVLSIRVSSFIVKKLQTQTKNNVEQQTHNKIG